MEEAGFRYTLSFPATLVCLPVPPCGIPMPRPSGLGLVLESVRWKADHLRSPFVAGATPSVVFTVFNVKRETGFMQGKMASWGGTIIFLPYLAGNTGVSDALLKITETFRGRLDASQIELFRHLLPHSANIHGIFIIRSLIRYEVQGTQR